MWMVVEGKKIFLCKLSLQTRDGIVSDYLQ